MRAVSATMRRAISDADSAEVAAILLTITHASLSAPIRVSSDPTQRISDDPLQYGTVSRGETYLFLPFDTKLPDEQEDKAPEAQIVIENVSRQLVPILRSIRDRAIIRMEMVLADAPDAVEVRWPRLRIQSARITAEAITLTPGMDALSDEPFPAGRFNPSYFPALF